MGHAGAHLRIFNPYEVPVCKLVGTAGHGLYSNGRHNFDKKKIVVYKKNQMNVPPVAYPEVNNVTFDLLYDTFAESLKKVLTKKVTGDKETAEDLVQDTFLKVSQKLHLYDSQKGSLTAWLHTIAINTARDHWDKTRRRRSCLGRLEEDAELLPSHPTFLVSDARIDLKCMLSELNQRELEHVRFILQGCTLRQIARLQGLSLGTINRRHKVVYGKFRKRLSKEICSTNTHLTGRLHDTRFPKSVYPDTKKYYGVFFG